MGGVWLTWVQVAGNALLRDRVKPLDVVVAVPNPQQVSGHQRAAHSEVDVLAVLERLQVPVALLRRSPHKPGECQQERHQLGAAQFWGQNR